MLLPKPRGWSSVGAFVVCRRPRMSSSWLPASATEWMASASIAPEPVNRAATPLATAMAVFAKSAKRTDFRESAWPAIPENLPHQTKQEIINYWLAITEPVFRNDNLQGLVLSVTHDVNFDFTARFDVPQRPHHVGRR